MGPWGRGMKQYNKAVRDNIPAIIRAQGKECLTKQVSDAVFLTYMEAKLSEELEEYQEAPSAEELADLLEVIYRVAELRGTSREELEEVRRKKCQERGGFAENLVLIAAEEE